ncbi:hypothetical protein [Streptomyces sp. NPDC091259]|uniref:hypothetical protein n=1 Tax=Streptomyces sp. NPDC091259 TaxID=3365976 RepID=UPI003807D3BD
MGFGPAPRRATAACAATAVLSAALLGCTTATPAAAPGGSPAPHTTSPRELCDALITHWATVILDGDEGSDGAGDPVRLDYQAMGLSGGQNDILRAVVETARAERRAHGPAAARELAGREAARRCAERYRSGTPTGGPWQ